MVGSVWEGERGIAPCVIRLWVKRGRWGGAGKETDWGGRESLNPKPGGRGGGGHCVINEARPAPNETVVNTELPPVSQYRSASLRRKRHPL